MNLHGESFTGNIHLYSVMGRLFPLSSMLLRGERSWEDAEPRVDLPLEMGRRVTMKATLKQHSRNDAHSMCLGGGGVKRTR